MFILEPAETCCAFFPRWDNDVILKRRFVTVIVAAEEGDEQRSGIHPTPAHSLSYNLITRNIAETTYLKRRFNKYINKVWAVPVWPYNMELTSEATAGSNVLNVNSAFYRELDSISSNNEYADVILVADYKTTESGEIVSFDETSIILAQPLSSTWKQGSKLYPLMKATLNYAINLESLTPDNAKINFEFHESFRSIVSGEV